MNHGDTETRSAARRGRRPRWQTAALHMVLVLLSALFLVPLFWLIGSSLKTDDQIKAFPPEWIPDLPYYSGGSLYIDAHQYRRLPRPEACPPAAWPALRDRLLAEARQAIAARNPWWMRPVERESLARGAVTEALSFLPPKAYAASAGTVVAEACRHLPEGAGRAWSRALRQLALGSVTLQGEGARSGLARTFAQLEWTRATGKVMAGSVGPVDGQSATPIGYEEPWWHGQIKDLGWWPRSARGSCGSVRARLPWTPELDGFRNFTLKLHGDRSWRYLRVTLATPRGLFRTAKPILLSSASWTDAVLIRQERGALPWGTYRLVSVPGAPAPGGASLEIEVLSATRAQVILRKLWNNYPSGLTFIPFARYLANTLLICFLVVLGTILSCSLVAYGLARVQWRGRHALFYVIIGTMMLPFQVTMVPMFVVFARLGWVDSFLPLIVPAFFGNAFFIFLLRQFFLTLPPELTDAARIDGCSELDIYARVVLPLAKPALATVGLFAFMNTWNDYVGPLIYLSDASKYTLSLGLATFSSQYGSYPGMLMAVTAVVTIPIIVLFFLAQRTFIQGITLTGIKG